MADNDFWNPINPQDGKPLKRHAPDDGQYHLPDARMMDKLGGSPVGMFAVVPRARANGASTGFNCAVAGTVHVDPDAPDGGVIVDCAQLHKQAVDQAVATSYYPHQAFYQLGASARALGIDKYGRHVGDDGVPVQPGYGTGAYQAPSQGNYGHAYGQQIVQRDNPHLPPGSYLTPQATKDGGQANYDPVNDGMPASPMFKMQEEQRMNPVPPLSSLQPRQAPPPMQQPMQAAMVAEQPPIYAPPPPAYQPMTQPQYAAPQYGQYQPPQPLPPDPQMMAMMQNIANSLNALNNKMTAPAPPMTPPPPLMPSPLTTTPRAMPPGYNSYVEHRPQYQPREDENGVFDEGHRPTPVTRPKKRASQQQEEEPEQPQRLTAYQQKQASECDPRDGIITGFETLQLPFVSGPIANKPTRQVFFEIPNAGKHSARYHDVVESDHAVLLIYDTRYEEGHQYLPPDMSGQEHVINLHVPHLKKMFHVASMGFGVPFGVFDLLFMPKMGEEVADNTK